ncbi:PLDc N-terminal domain-containing protein [Pseudomonas phoenicis]|uniref:PLDc N-terminal domain-containing protein n=1 Tax=unclassified Pseudomonas TaxID=196821 RepID=UPI0039A389AC
MFELNTYVWIGSAVIVLLVDLWIIVSVFRSEKSPGTKLFWALLVVLLPVLGMVIWGVAGPRGIKPGTGPSSPNHSKG